MKFYEEENGKQISFWKFLEINKLTSGNPTHSFELLKSHRLKQYEDKLVASTDKRLLNELETTLFDISMLYSEWLNNEMKVVEQWLSDKHPNGDKKKPLSFAEQDEIEKYKTFISNEIDSTVLDKPNNKKQITDTSWFKVGLLFATGEMEKMINKHNGNFTQIAKEIYSDNWGSYRPYMSESVAERSANDKNIFHNLTKIKQIQDYCILNNIEMIDSFSSIKSID